MAEIVAAFPDVKVAVADAGRLHLEQHLRTRGLRRRMIDLLQGGVELGDLETLHRFSPVILVLDTPRYLDQRMMASDELTRRHGAQFRHLIAASPIRPRAAGAETAAGRRRDRRWRLA